ncbi:hypothetical protein NDU88_003701 [Pleurodeles waltl]|uniref:Uncharacterized protein n=1 Tax=Pleurodeles waltl TaxID=8319 RepID=A0AAV7V0Q7_PLEWA|nr:hypothetical protein NDU88_003701 [Pleurodeles waltl]
MESDESRMNPRLRAWLVGIDAVPRVAGLPGVVPGGEVGAEDEDLRLVRLQFQATALHPVGDGLHSVVEGVDFGVLPAFQEGGGLEGAVDDHSELGDDDGACFVEDVMRAGVGCGCRGGRGIEAVMDVYDLAVKEGGEGVAEVSQRWGVVGAGSGVGDVEEHFAVVCIVVDAFLVGGSLGGPDELVVPVDGVFEGSVVDLCLFVAPLLLEFSALPFGGLEVCSEPDGLSVGAVVGEFFLIGARVLAQSSINCLRL